MSTLTQTVTVPANRRVQLDFFAPGDIPLGTAEIRMEIAAVKPPGHGRDILPLAGTLANSKTFAGDAVKIVREMRDEW